MKNVAVEVRNPPMSLVVRVSRVPKRGSWFNLGDGTPAQAKDIRTIGGEPVIFATIESETSSGSPR